MGFCSVAAKAFRSIAAWALALRCCSIAARALSLCSRSSREGFSFLLPEQKKRNKENSPSPLFCLLRHLSPLNKKNSLTLKQLFVFHAPKSTSASRQKSEAGPYCFFATSLRLLGRDVFFSFARSFLSFRAEQSVVKDLSSIAQPINGLLVGA